MADFSGDIPTECPQCSSSLLTAIDPEFMHSLIPEISTHYIPHDDAPMPYISEHCPKCDYQLWPKE